MINEIINTFEFNINWKVASKNPYLTMNILKQLPDKDWDFNKLSSHPNLTMNILKQLPDKCWDFNKLSSHPNLTMDILEQLRNKEWNWENISYRPILTVYGLKLLRNKNWDWDFIFRRSRLINEIINTFGFDIDWKVASENPNLTMNTFLKYPNSPWDFNEIYRNLISSQYKKFINSEMKTFAILKILKQCSNSKFNTMLENERIVKNILKFKNNK